MAMHTFKLKIVLVIEILLFISCITSYDEKLIEELVNELKELEKSWKKNNQIDNNSLGPTQIEVDTTTEAKVDDDDNDDDDEDANDDNDDINKLVGDDDGDDDDDNKEKKQINNIIGGRNNGEGKNCTNCYNIPSESDIIRAIMTDQAEDKLDKASLPPACNRNQPLVITDQRGIILSPGFDENKTVNNLNCSWRFVTPKGLVSKITFLIFDLTYDEDCLSEFVEVFDVRNGMPVAIGKYCGNNVPSELLKSSEQDLYLYFVTGDNGQIGKFSLKFESVDPRPLEPSSQSCGRPSIKPDVSQTFANVRPALAGSWPWQVRIKAVNDVKNKYLCGGSIISPEVVMLAAHCLFINDQIINASHFEVIAGEYDLIGPQDEHAQISNIKEFHIHENFDLSNNTSDIALIVLESPFKFNDRVQEICLPRENFALNDLCYSTGWGDIKYTGDMSVLHQVRLPIIPQTTCGQLSSFGSDLEENQFCAGFIAGKRMACQGDSGGPFVCYNDQLDRWFQFGVTSRGVECGQGIKHGIYVRVTSYLDWITINAKVSP